MEAGLRVGIRVGGHVCSLLAQVGAACSGSVTTDSRSSTKSGQGLGPEHFAGARSQLMDQPVCCSVHPRVGGADTSPVPRCFQVPAALGRVTDQRESRRRPDPFGAACEGRGGDTLQTTRNPNGLVSDLSGVRITARQLVIVGGIVFWIGAALVGAGASAITALVTNLALVAAATVVCSATRTIRVRVVAVAFLLGGFAMSVMYVIARALLARPPISAGTMSWSVIAPLEELAKIAPIVGLLWWGRRRGTWALAASDVLLIGVAAGAGFAFVEDAYIRSRFGYAGALSWMPTAQDTGAGLIAGHAVWTGVFGAFLGLALLVRWNRLLAGLIALVGFAVALASHVQNNYISNQGRKSDALGDLLTTITAHGWLPLVVLFVAGAVCIGADLVVRFVLRDAPEVRPSAVSSQSPLEQWSAELDRRGLAMASFQARRAGPPRQAQAGAVAHAYRLALGVASAGAIVLAAVIGRHWSSTVISAALNVGANGIGFGPLGGFGAGAAAGGMAGGDGDPDGGNGDGVDGDDGEDDDC